jgi:hypothetical protein
LDSQFHFRTLNPEELLVKRRKYRVKRGKLSPFHFRFTTSGDATSGDATSGDVISGDATSDDVISGYATSGEVISVTSRSGDATSGTTSLHHLK